MFNKISAPGAMVWMVCLSSLVMTACRPDEETTEGLNACGKSHAIRRAIDLIEADYRYLLSQGKGSRIPIEEQSKVFDLLNEQFGSDPDIRRFIVYARCDRYGDTTKDRGICKARYDRGKYGHGKEEEEGKLYDLIKPKPREFFAHADKELGSLVSQFEKTRKICKEGGLGVQELPDGRVEVAPVKCEKEVSATEPQTGYKEARLLKEELENVGLFVSARYMSGLRSNVEQVEELLKRIERIKTNGVAVYLELKCATSEAFARIDDLERPGVKAKQENDGSVKGLIESGILPPQKGNEDRGDATPPVEAI